MYNYIHLVKFMGKKSHNLVVGLDIGSTAVRMAIGQLVERAESRERELQILGATEVPSEGLHRGIISSIEDVVSSISSCLERTERVVGASIDSVWLGVSGTHVMSQQSKGVVAVSKADSDISEEDVRRAVEAARAIATPINYEVLHVLPHSFGVDGQVGIKDPVGMTGIRLDVDAQIILGSSSQIKNLTKAVYRAGLDIEDLVLSIIATAEAVLTGRQKDLGVAVVNIGGSTTSLAVYEEGDLLHNAVLPIGSEHITNDLAIGLRTTIDIAERAKIKYGDCWHELAGKKDEIDLFELGAERQEMIKKKYLSEIIGARVEEIFYKVDQELKTIQRSGLLPAGVVLTGGGAKLPGLVESAKNNLRLPATLGYPFNITSVTDKINDLGFSTAVGLVKWGSMMKFGGYSREDNKMGNKINAVFSQFKKWTKTLIP